MPRSLTHFILAISFFISCSLSFGFSESLSLGNNPLKKSGESQLKAFGFVKLFEAALYLEEGYEPRDFPGEFSYGLSIRYNRKFRKETLIKSADNILKDLHSASDLSAIQENLEKINQYYVDVGKGDTYTLVYHPENGTTLLYNDEPLVTVEGEDFAKIYFSIWLGGHPKSKALKEDLLEG